MNSPIPGPLYWDDQSIPIAIRIAEENLLERINLDWTVQEKVSLRSLSRSMFDDGLSEMRLRGDTETALRMAAHTAAFDILDTLIGAELSPWERYALQRSRFYDRLNAALDLLEQCGDARFAERLEGRLSRDPIPSWLPDPIAQGQVPSPDDRDVLLTSRLALPGLGRPIPEY